jgi:hypothetical protein
LIEVIGYPANSPLAEIVPDLTNRTETRLVPRGEYSEAIRKKLLSLTPESALGTSIADSAAAQSVISGLLLWNDSLDESHSMSQQIETPTGSYWHGIMHRREPDYSNAKYWFRKVGNHPVFADLSSAVADHLRNESKLAETSSRKFVDTVQSKLEARSTWDPFLFVDLCEKHGDGASAGMEEKVLVALQDIEIRLLLNFCIRSACRG